MLLLQKITFKSIYMYYGYWLVLFILEFNRSLHFAMRRGWKSEQHTMPLCQSPLTQMCPLAVTTKILVSDTGQAGSDICQAKKT